VLATGNLAILVLATLYNSLRPGGNARVGFLLIVFTLLTIVCVEILAGSLDS